MGVLVALLPALLGLLGEMVAAFLSAWNSKHAADPNLLAVLNGYVVSAEANPLLKDGDAKYQWVFDQMKAYLVKEGKEMADSMLNTLIELAVQKLPSLAAVVKP